MRTLNCASTRRRLHAFHDGELSVTDQIAVAAHLEWCDGCAHRCDELRFVRAALRAAAPGRAMASHDVPPAFSAAVVNRLKAEDDQAFVARLRQAFDDMHFVYAGAGAVVAATVCLIIMLGVMRFATIERPDSLAAIVNLLASPGSNEYPVVVDARTSMPRALDATISAGASAGATMEQDAVFALAAVVTREGRVENLEMLDSHDGGVPGVNQARVVQNIMRAISRARFEPAQREGLPVAVNMVWLVAHTTVRATKRDPLDSVLPLVKKRSASLGLRTPAYAQFRSA
ncbi:MAG: zf-HC2 domain-containing protein [Acidobacteria bacterium]|nr:zf-HC2 domain-containing protein [Acidobacteriota bacterium]